MKVMRRARGFYFDYGTCQNERMIQDGGRSSDDEKSWPISKTWRDRFKDWGLHFSLAMGLILILVLLAFRSLGE